MSISIKMALDNKNDNLLPLYIKDKSGKVRYWNIKLIPYKDYTEIEINYGVLNGKLTKSTIKIEKGKNIGKKNETTHYTQAYTEAISKWTKKKDIEHYTTANPLQNTLDKLTTQLQDFTITTSPPVAMLAHDYKKYKHKIEFPCYIQRKYDGYRLLYDHINKDMYTRNGKKYEILYKTELYKQLQNIDLPFDGELYCHDGFNFECYGVLRKK